MPETSTVLGGGTNHLDGTTWTLVHPTHQPFPVNEIFKSKYFPAFFSLNQIFEFSNRVEPTSVTMDFLENDQFHSGLSRDVYLHPSILTPVNNYQHMNYLNLDHVYRNDLIQRQSTRTTKRFWFTRTIFVTENVVTTNTNMATLYGCAPSPLPFDLCVWFLK
jgi:hypothetical protein